MTPALIHGVPRPPEGITTIDCHSHFVASMSDAAEQYKRLVASPQIDCVCVGTLGMKLKRSDVFPLFAKISGTNDGLLAMLEEVASPKLIPFAYVDPRPKSAAKEVERLAKRGFRGIEMFPPIGWYPSEPRVLPAFQAAEALRLPVYLHMGRTAPHPELRSKYADPIELEDVGLACPDLRLIIGHFAAPWSREASHIAMGFPHWRFGLETSGILQRETVIYCRDRKDIGVGRLLLGTNGNGANNLKLADACVRRLREYGFSESDVAAVAHDNAAAFLCLCR